MSAIINGDALTELKKLDSESVNCCVTSPPYWGLRDYGTAEWDGGSDNCDHKEPEGKPRKQTSNEGSVGLGYKDTCKKCGAKRIDKQLGLEKTPEEYVAKMVRIFSEVKRVLKDDGTLWLNLGDSYASGQASGDKKFGNEEFNKNRPSRERTHTPERKRPINLKPKDLVGIPWMVAFALRSDGWYLRQDIIWHKPNPMPESVTDRCTKSHEYIFLMSKSPKYYYDNEAIQEKAIAERWGGHKPINPNNSKGDINGLNRSRDMMPELRNKRSVWTVTTKPYKEAHFATFPEDLITPCILAGCPEGGVVLDPFAGAGTTLYVAREHSRKYLGVELNEKYIGLINKRLAQQVLF